MSNNQDNGNAAAMREALEGMCKASQDVFRRFARETFYGERRLDSLGVAFDKAKAALSAPANESVTDCNQLNAAAMREALEFVEHMNDSSYTTYDVLVAIQKARAALSAPARNCDMQYKDQVEMYYAFKDWCKAKGHTMEPMLAYDAFDWLLAPAAERKGEGDENK